MCLSLLKLTHSMLNSKLLFYNLNWCQNWNLGIKKFAIKIAIFKIRHFSDQNSFKWTDSRYASDIKDTSKMPLSQFNFFVLIDIKTFKIRSFACASNTGLCIQTTDILKMSHYSNSLIYQNFTSVKKALKMLLRLSSTRCIRDWDLTSVNGYLWVTFDHFSNKVSFLGRKKLSWPKSLIAMPILECLIWRYIGYIKPA